jgi:hypothetical protein
MAVGQHKALLETNFLSTLDFIGHIEDIRKDVQALLETIGAWNEHGKYRWGLGNESIFTSRAIPLTRPAKAHTIRGTSSCQSTIRKTWTLLWKNDLISTIVIAQPIAILLLTKLNNGVDAHLCRTVWDDASARN